MQTRDQFHASRDDIHALMRKMLEVRQSVSVSYIFVYLFYLIFYLHTYVLLWYTGWGILTDTSQFEASRGCLGRTVPFVLLLDLKKLQVKISRPQRPPEAFKW